MCKKKEKNKKTNNDRDKRKKNLFTLVTKRIKRAHTVISDDI